MKRTYHLHAQDITEDVKPKTPPPGGVSFKVYEILVRDPERNFGRWCSAYVQQTAELFRYEVEYEIPDDSDLSTDLSEWAGDFEIDLVAETEEMYREVWFDSTTFDNWPHAVVEVEVDDEDLEGLDKTGYACSKKFIDQLHEDEAGCPTNVPRPNTKPAPAGAKES